MHHVADSQHTSPACAAACLTAHRRISKLYLCSVNSVLSVCVSRLQMCLFKLHKATSTTSRQACFLLLTTCVTKAGMDPSPRLQHISCCLTGVDALSVHLILTVIAATLSIGISWKAVVGSLGVMIPWQLAHWEEYHTGTRTTIVDCYSYIPAMLVVCVSV